MEFSNEEVLVAYQEILVVAENDFYAMMRRDYLPDNVDILREMTIIRDLKALVLDLQVEITKNKLKSY